MGVLFNYNNSFKKAQKDRCKLANSAMFSLLRKCRKANFPLDIQLELFERCVVPILLFGCEVWGFEDSSMCIKFQLKFLKMLLGVQTTTPSCMVFGETGCFPVDIEIKCRLLSFWYKLKFDASDVATQKISGLMLTLCTRQFENTQFKLPWLQNVMTLLNNLGLSFLWDSPLYSLSQFKSVVRQRLKDQYLQTWRSTLRENSVCCNYILCKDNFVFENYLLRLPIQLRQPLLKFRLCNHKLPIQRKRFENIPRDERICTLCDMHEIGDEFHYLFNCQFPIIKQNRLLLLPAYYNHHPNVLKFNMLLNVQSMSKLVKLAKFIRIILKVCS